jgi:predicted MFS family arabinose efflux permease
MNAVPGDAALPRYVWYVVALLAIVNVCNYMDRMALAVLAPAIKAELRLSDGEVGLLTGFAFAIFYAICGIPIARWADRGIRRNIIALALTVWSGMTALCGVAQNFWHLFGARIGVGAGEAGCLPPAQSIICDYVPLQRRPGVFALHIFGLYAGMMVGMALAGGLGEMLGWRLTFVVLGLPGIALALLVRLTLREPVRGTFDTAVDSGSRFSFRETVQFLWECRTYRFLMMFDVLSGFVQYGLSQWWPSFYEREFGLGLARLGTSLGLSIGAGSGVGLLLGGLAANKLMQRDVRLPLFMSAAVTALAIPTALGSLFASSTTYSMLLVAMTAFFWGTSASPVVASLYGVMRPGMRATAGALTIFFQSLFGFGLGPFCVGLLSDGLMPAFGAEALRYALLAPVCLMPILVLVMSTASKTLRRDLQRVGARWDGTSGDVMSAEEALAKS